MVASGLSGQEEDHTAENDSTVIMNYEEKTVFREGIKVETCGGAGAFLQ